ncbi:MAG: hypothetical protein KDE56_00600 [Anaerolineales bacterium]|nr:hypothetical protein [Anaerolineales bacterium]
MMNKFYLLLYLLVSLTFGCNSSENELKLDTNEPPSAHTAEEIAKIDIGNVIRSGKFEQHVETDEISQNNCRGKSPVSFSVSRERTLEQSVDLTLSGQGELGLEIADKPMGIGLAGTIIAAIGAEYGQHRGKIIADTSGMEFTIESGDFPTYIINWRESWEKGYILIQYNDESLQVPYLYLTTARPELVDVRYKDCGTGETIQSTTQENTPVEATKDLQPQLTNTPSLPTSTPEAPQPSPTPTLAQPAETLTRPQSVYTVRMFNVDDIATLYINGNLAYKAQWGQSGVEGNWNYFGHKAGDSGEIDVTSLLKLGQNSLRFELWNKAICCGVSLSIEIKENGEIIASDSYSIQDSGSGIKYDKTFSVIAK